ncbi:type II secretion system protein N, partial [Arthrospira platensis SPKY1]|nr:type II secretion system protein N [Arthrospira platensis SPKY1]
LHTTEPAGVRGAIQDQGGPLALDGVLNLAPDGGYRFNGRTTIRDAGDQSLRQALDMLGPADNDGYWTLSFSGVLAP